VARQVEYSEARLYLELLKGLGMGWKVRLGDAGGFG